MKSNQISFKELMYYLFFGLMIFAKGIGLDSGDKLYMVLSVTASVCVAAKIIMTRHTVKEILAMGVLGTIAFVSYRNSGRMGIMLTALAIAGIKDVDVKRLFKIGLYIYGISFAATVLLAGWGLIPNPLVVHEKGAMGEVIRWGMGYSTGNVFHISYFILVVFCVYCDEKPFVIKKLLILMAGNVLVYLYSLSYTGVAVTAFYLLLSFYFSKRKKCNLVEMGLSQLFFPFVLLFSLLGPFFLDYAVIKKIDSLLQARLSFSHYYLTNQPITFLGTRMKDVPTFWVIMDNGYVYILMTFGIITMLLFCGGYFLVIARYTGISAALGKKAVADKDKNGGQRLKELSIVFSFLLYGVMEQFISNAFMNLSLFFVGSIFFELLWCKENNDGWNKEFALFTKRLVVGERTCLQPKPKKIFAEIKLQPCRISCRWALGAAGGILGLFLYIFVAAKPEFVTVPMEALRYINAESVLVNGTNVGGTKKELKELAGQYQEILEKDSVINEALRHLPVALPLSPDEIRAMLEVSIPNFEQEKEKMSNFRVRLIELYYDVDEKTYRALLQALLDVTGKERERLGLEADAVFDEQIGLSFGTERIEHIGDYDEYMVEKSGRIVEIEKLRNGILWIICGIILGNLVGLFLKWGIDKRKTGYI